MRFAGAPLTEWVVGARHWRMETGQPKQASQFPVGRKATGSVIKQSTAL
jgi:hypothetical protein